MFCNQGHTPVQQGFFDAVLFHSVLRPAGHFGAWSHQSNCLAGVCEQLGDHTPQIVMIVIVYQHSIRTRQAARHDVVWCEHLGMIRDPGYRCVRHPPQSISTPLCSGRDQDLIGSELGNAGRIHFAAGEKTDVGEFCNLPQPVVADPFITRETRQPGLKRGPAAPIPAVRKRHVVAALTKTHRRLKPGGTCTHHQHLFTLSLVFDDFRMPAAPPFFPHRGILGTAKR